MATGRALLPAEPLSEAAYQAGLEAMFAAVDESFPSTADADEADARAAEHDNWALLPDVRSAKTPDGVLVVAASVNTLDDAAVARITQQAAQVVEKQRGRTGANDR
ncbi:hypothetical protein [Kitasatospora sp. NPDC090091]|uniref:hypothetical protein n=1 Tax=Kitasatospora sp. NPDC090091 TaxID=3364081 RepID=UPI0038013728